MKEEEKKELQDYLADTIMERPYAFEIDGRPFYLFPVTLGKSYLLSRILGEIGLDFDNLELNPYLEALRVAKTHRDDSVRYIVYNTIKKKDKLFDYKFIDCRCKFFSEHLSDEDIANLLIIILSIDKTERFVKYLGIDKELELKRRVSEFKKNDGGSVSIGGKSVYGTMIDFACERYGWSYEYVVWGISLVNLRMLMDDVVTTPYLTSDERKRLRIPTDRTIISGDSKENIKKFKKHFKD